MVTSYKRGKNMPGMVTALYDITQVSEEKPGYKAYHKEYQED